MAKFGRSYASKGDFESRLTIFKSNLASIVQHNSQEGITHVKGVNQFTDMTEQELDARFNQKALKVPKTKTIKHSSVQRLSTLDLPKYVNWYEAGKVSESVDQTGCGACWAFTTATTLESLNAIQNNLSTVPHYSVQYLMDCDDVDWGCDGGWMLDAYEFTRERGIVAWSDYDRTYNARKNTCSDPSYEIQRFHNTGGIEEDMISNQRMKEIVSRQPVGVAMASNLKCMTPYKSGILTEKDCHCSDPERLEVNHAVTIIGYGISDVAGCDEYWVIKNSWGPEWGVHGTFKLCADRVGIAEEFGVC